MPATGFGLYLTQGKVQLGALWVHKLTEKFESKPKRETVTNSQWTTPEQRSPRSHEPATPHPTAVPLTTCHAPDQHPGIHTLGTRPPRTLMPLLCCARFAYQTSSDDEVSCSFPKSIKCGFPGQPQSLPSLLHLPRSAISTCRRLLAL